jgi:enoyl-CoA hydratase/carnithine racemase
MSELVQITSWDDVPRGLSDGAVLIALGEGKVTGDAVTGIRRLRELQVPAVAALSGACGPADLAAALACSIAYADLTVSFELRDTAGLLELGIPWELQRRGAGWLLFAPAPLSSAALVSAGLALTGSPADSHLAAQRLAADADNGLLVRSLRAAVRSSAGQSAIYDAELASLVTARTS